MNFSGFVAYVELINKVITLCSPIVPLIAFICRRLGLTKSKPSNSSGLVELVAMAGFGCFGGALGLFLVLGSAVVIAVIVGVNLYQMQAAAAASPETPGMQLPPLHLDSTSLISAAVSIVSTLIIFGGHSKLRGLAFLGGCCFGAAIGIMVVASWFLH